MLNWIKWLVLSVIALVVIALLGVYFSVRLSLPRLEGNDASSYVIAPVSLARDSLGHAIINAESRTDAAYALGFAHGQDRLFQMDLQRKAAAGELSSLVGRVALSVDKQARFHQFRTRAKQVFEYLPQWQKDLLITYTQGVNAAINEYSVKPFEYLALGGDIEKWSPEDSILVAFSMYLDLQGGQINHDLARTVLKDKFGDHIYQFITQPSNFQAALDGSVLAPYTMGVPEFPQELRVRSDSNEQARYSGTEPPDIGSNNWAVTGALTETGSAMLANDMHLGLRVPIIWYRTQLNYVINQSSVSVTGVTLPGLPGIIVGTNNHVAWGFTNANLDNIDWVLLSPDTTTSIVSEDILLPNDKETIELELSEFGPVKEVNGQKYALRWVAHQSFAVNLTINNMDQALSVDDAIAVGRSISIPTQNLVMVDAQGNAAWTPGGAVLQRDTASFTAISESEALATTPQRTTDLPVYLNPENGRIWTANARVISADDYERLGDGGYALGARGLQIRDRLFEKSSFNENDFYAIQLDNHAAFLSTWHRLLINTVQDGGSDFTLDRALLTQWGACACSDSVGYTLVKHFRRSVIQSLFGPILTQVDEAGARSRTLLRGIEPATWQILATQPESWLPPGFATFDEFLLATYEQSRSELFDKYGKSEDYSTLRWGNVNKLAVVHPFAAQIPLVGEKLNMRQVEGFGDTYMPSVQARSFGASQRLFVSPGHLEDAILTLPGGQSGHPLSPYYTAGFDDYVTQAATPLLPSDVEAVRHWYPKSE